MTTETIAALDVSEAGLYRQVNPSWVHEGRVSSQVFQPTPKDELKVSVDRSSLSSPEQSYLRFVDNGWPSIGVWEVTVEEVHSVSLQAYPDPNPGWDNPAHAYVHFVGLSGGAQKKTAQKLAAIARARGWVYPL